MRFDATFYSGNRQRLRAACPEDAPIIIAANARMQRNADVAFPFQQDSNFMHLSGIKEPSALLVIEPTESYVILPEQSDYLSYFHGQQAEKQLMQIAGIDAVLDAKAGWQKLAARVKTAGQVYSLTPPPAFIDVYGMYTNPARQELVEKIIAIDKTIEVLDIRQQLAALRMVKQPTELQALQEAVELTVAAFRAVKQQKLRHEKEIEAAFSIFFLEHGQQWHGYDPIVAGGKNACVMHYGENAQTVNSNELVLIDIGAAIDGYSADITRVFPIDQPTKRQREVHEAVLAVQNYALSLQKPGANIRDNEKLIEAFMGEQLMSLGLIKKPEREAIRHYFPHATSHFLGLDVHDLGDYDAPLTENMVLTVEPGIYVPEEGIGVRIEDDVLITADGHKIMSDALPRDL